MLKLWIKAKRSAMKQTLAKKTKPQNLLELKPLTVCTLQVESFCIWQKDPQRRQGEIRAFLLICTTNLHNRSKCSLCSLLRLCVRVCIYVCVCVCVCVTFCKKVHTILLLETTQMIMMLRILYVLISKKSYCFQAQLAAQPIVDKS